MYSTYFQEWLSETFKPCNLVYSSEMAREAIKKNNLSPADFLRPLGDFTGKKIEITIYDFNHFLRDFRKLYVLIHSLGCLISLNKLAEEANDSIVFTVGAVCVSA